MIGFLTTAARRPYLIAVFAVLLIAGLIVMLA